MVDRVSVIWILETVNMKVGKRQSCHIRKALKRLGLTSLNEYYQTPHWKELRQKILKKGSSGRCQVCHKGENLQLHHLTYKRLGQEMLCDLVFLCGECHHSLHIEYEALYEKGRVYLWQATRRKIRVANKKRKKAKIKQKTAIARKRAALAKRQNRERKKRESFKLGVVVTKSQISQ